MTTEPKCRPILFQPDMVKAIIAGTKTQTRRLLSPQPPANFDLCGTGYVNAPKYWAQFIANEMQNGCWSKTPDMTVECPYGRPGDNLHDRAADTLWVREAWSVPSIFDNYKPSQLDPRTVGNIRYHADGVRASGRYRHPRFMPRVFSRLTLEIVDVRVERLQDITEDDAKDEGITVAPGHMFRPMGSKEPMTPYTHRQAFSALWDSINGKTYPWESNCWVWVIEFRRLDQ